ncbi:hypothetical protein NECAME_14516 [Necator americanus]|uniref:Uncharacterized protein n=1 Tax=Necator americanus TaxID=51031 RepID=W2SMC8_NECAM|nr:hypothetical protein NECAME_14516 [Necator americanus]ETN70824.1 hypothetical protein NECAME_14516 [Necator americanus]
MIAFWFSFVPLNPLNPLNHLSFELFDERFDGFIIYASEEPVLDSELANVEVHTTTYVHYENRTDLTDGNRKKWEDGWTD